MAEVIPNDQLFFHESETSPGSPQSPDSHFHPHLSNLDGSPTEKGSVAEFSIVKEGGQSPQKVMKRKPILGNSASGLLLHPKGGQKEELPKSVFSSKVSLPKLKQFQSHRKFVELNGGKPQPSYEPLSYQGYIEDSGGNTDEFKLKKTFNEMLDSRYRPINPLSEKPRMTWLLFTKLKQARPQEKLALTDLNNYDLHIDKQTEQEYLKVALDVSNEEEPYDGEKKDFVGTNAIQEYHKHYKIINKVELENDIKKCKNSLYTNILATSSKSNLLPMRLNVVKSVGSLNSINTR